MKQKNRHETCLYLELRQHVMVFILSFLWTRYSGEYFLSHHGWTWLIKCILSWSWQWSDISALKMHSRSVSLPLVGDYSLKLKGTCTYRVRLPVNDLIYNLCQGPTNASSLEIPFDVAFTFQNDDFRDDLNWKTKQEPIWFLRK